MNRFKKEEARKYRESRSGLSELEIKRLDRDKLRNSEIFELAQSIHEEWFPEEYDHVYDSVAEANERKRGINPMSEGYIADVENKRKTMTVSLLSESGMSICNDSWQIAYTEAGNRMKKRTK